MGLGLEEEHRQDDGGRDGHEDGPHRAVERVDQPRVAPTRRVERVGHLVRGRGRGRVRGSSRGVERGGHLREGACMEAAGGLPGGVRGGVQRVAVQRAPRAAWRLLAATPCGSGRTRGARCTMQVQARCRRGAGAVQVRWATHLECGDGHVGVALVLVLGRQPVVIAHVGHCAEEDHRGRRAVVRDEGADPPLKDAPTARACGAWGGRCGCA